MPLSLYAGGINMKSLIYSEDGSQIFWLTALLTLLYTFLAAGSALRMQPCRKRLPDNRFQSGEKAEGRLEALLDEALESCV
jgi:hypothetical protein